MQDNPSLTHVTVLRRRTRSDVTQITKQNNFTHDVNRNYQGLCVYNCKVSNTVEISWLRAK